MEITNVTQIPSSAIQGQQLIGSGGFGDVYKATWNNISVAVKRLHLKTMPKELQESFNQEAVILAKCNFPNIVRLYGVCTEPGSYAMVMELMPKGSLYDVLHNPDEILDWSLRLQIAVDIATGLAYLHQNNIIHRDLKSLNVLLDASYKAKITDFGLAKVKLETNSTTTMNKTSALGSTRWRAPELFKRKSSPTFASDVYGCGMILWEIATRKLPFADAMDDVTVVTWITGGELEEIPNDCPEGYGPVIENCWKEATQRPPASDLIPKLTEALKSYEQKNPKKPQQQQPDNSLSGAKSWHFDPSTKQSLPSTNNNTATNHVLIPASKSDIDKVMKHYSHHPVPNMDIKSVQVIYNPTLNRAFELRLALLQQRAGKDAFAPRWTKKNDANSAKRQVVNKMWEKLTSPYIDEDYPDVKLLPVWHGTNPNVLPVLFETGYANLATTDSGYFGKGIYGSYEAEYAHRVYSKGAIILNWMSAFSALPTVFDDMQLLQGKGNHENYDAHFVPVIPPTGKTSNTSSVYYPCTPSQEHQYIEIVVFDAAQVLPRYLVELQPSLPKSPSAPGVPPRPSNAGQSSSWVATKTPSNRDLSSLASSLQKTNLNSNTQVPSSSLLPGEQEHQDAIECFIKYNIKDCVTLLEKSVSQNYIPAIIRLAKFYTFSGVIGPKDEPKSKSLLNRIPPNTSWMNQLNLNSYYVQLEIGEWYIIEKNSKEAAVWIQKAANQGYVVGETYLGFLYGTGDGVAKDQARAVSIWQKCAEKGYAVAQTNLGAYLESGLGVAADIKQAVYWYQKAADAGYANAQVTLGYIYARGALGQKDPQTAMYWYKRAIDQGSCLAMNNMGALYAEGNGVPQDWQQAAYWYMRAAEQDSVTALNNLGCLYQDGKGVPKDDAKQFHYHLRAAQLGHSGSQNAVGYAYREGVGIAQDYAKAFEWYQKSAAGNNLEALCSLGLLYIDGKGVAKNEKTGFDYYMKAAEQGHPQSLYAIGWCYENGRGAKKDLKQAKVWYQKAAAKGHQNSVQALKRL